MLPTLWFRNTWLARPEAPRPALRSRPQGRRASSRPRTTISGEPLPLLRRRSGELLFTENETNNQRLFGSANPTPYVKDGINNYVVQRQPRRGEPEQVGTKAAARGSLDGRPRRDAYRPPSPVHRRRGARRGHGTLWRRSSTSTVVRQRGGTKPTSSTPTSSPHRCSADAANVMRQALARACCGRKQFYFYDVDQWLASTAPARSTRSGSLRNGALVPHGQRRRHLDAGQVGVPVVRGLGSRVPHLRADDGRSRLRQAAARPHAARAATCTRTASYRPTSGTSATSIRRSTPGPTCSVYTIDKAPGERATCDWLERVFQKLLLNFTWWVNRKDRDGNNVFEGGFLGLDNIGVFDRSAPLPDRRLPRAGRRHRLDGALLPRTCSRSPSSWRCERPAYEDMAVKFFEHFLWIASRWPACGGEDRACGTRRTASSTTCSGCPTAAAQRLKVRSMVGLLPLCAVTVFDGRAARAVSRARRALASASCAARPELTANIHDPSKAGLRRPAPRLGPATRRKLRRVLARMLDENEFLSPYGIRSLSRYHEEHPYVLPTSATESIASATCRRSPTPGCSAATRTGAGRSGCRSTCCIIRALLQYYTYYGDDFTIECPTGSGRQMTLYQVAEELARRLVSIFLRDEHGRRPVYGGTQKFQDDPHWRDYLLFYEYFHGDNGAGLGASHQTGWTGIIARLMHLFATTTAEQALELGKKAAVAEIETAPIGARRVPRRDPPREVTMSEPRYPSLLPDQHAGLAERSSSAPTRPARDARRRAGRGARSTWRRRASTGSGC